MPTKYEVLSTLFKDELLAVAASYGIQVSKSWPKGDLVDVIGDKLSLAQIKKLVKEYTTVPENEIEEVDESVKEQSKGTRPASDVSDILGAMKKQKFTRDDLIDELKKKGYKLTQSGLSEEGILNLFPKFTDYIRNLLLGVTTGKGLEFRTYRWMLTDKEIKWEIRENGGELAIERTVQGKAGQTQFDVYFRVPERGFMKKGFLEGFVECKNLKSGITDNLISIFQGQVEDVCDKTGKAPLFAKFVSSSYYIQSAIDYAKHHPVRAYSRNVNIELWQEKEPGIFRRIQ